ncbi:beta strand repeat-containing protein, partial [Pantanalinema sp. GBBB05]|uniref:beta strand repeat-containing protein n=1 Tax=Pantanalinema sp. GBBB05 TaxID=2604139 RepID=UPI001DE6C0BB|nr:hypothetical protein [Pantanalinema sp. GBBB05]
RLVEGAGGAGGGAGNDGGDSGGSNGGTFGGGWSNNSNANNTGFDGGGGAGLGGAIFIRSGSLTLNTITFTGNSATGGAGRIYSGQGKGGAIFVLDSLTNANGNNQGMPTTLPTVLASGVTFAGNNATDNVSSTTPTGGIGSNQDNEDVYGTIAFGSNAPVVTVANNALTYTENGAPILLDTGATVTDTDSADFAGGALTVRFASGGIASDRLTIQSGGSVTLDGTKVLISGTQIGTYSGGLGTDNLVISLNSAANATTVQTLLRAIAYSSTDERLSTTPTNRTIEVTLADGDGGTSTAVTQNVTVTGVDDAPIVGERRVLYDGSLNTTPAAQGWVAVTAGSVETTSGGATTLNSTASLNLYAGYTRTSPIALDATQGYVLSFQAQVNAENRNATLGTGADKNGDGKFDRAGFSLLVVSSDNTRALELGFNLIGTNLQIWAQEDGTSQSNPSTQAGSVGDTNLLFTQAEGVTIANPGMGSYDVAVQGNTYTLFLNGTAILSGKLRNYTAATGPIDPYETPNLIFFGDDTTSASGSFSLASVGVTVAGNISDQTTLEDAAATLIPFGAFDLESYTLPSVTATDDPTLVANATFGGTGIARTLSLTPMTNAFGTATIQLDGSDGALAATDTFNITIQAVNDQPDTTPGANQTVTSGAGAQTVANWATFTPGPANESDQTATYTIVSNDNPSLFSVAPAIDASGNLTYTPAVGIATAQTATLTYRVQDNGGTANGGVDLSDVRSFTITINPPTIGLTAPDATAAESGTDTGTFRISRGSVTGGDLVVNLTIAGTSTASTADYTFSNNVSVSGSNLTVTIPDGQSFVDVVLTPILDAVVEGTETLTLNLATGSYGINSAQATVSVDITDAPVLSITAPDATATELPGNLGTYRITRTGDTSQDLVVNYTIGGTATNSTDYAPLTGTTTIAAGQSFVDVSLAPVNDNLVEGSETVVLTLAAGDYGISATDTATVDILDAPVLSVAATDATASELPGNSGSYRITRTGDTSQDLVVNYTIGGTATSGSDYTALTGMATIAAGQSFVDVTLTPINDTLVEGTETATLSVSANSTYNLDTVQNTASVDILDAPIVSVTAPDATATELAGDAGTFRITRAGDTTSALIVNYTVGGTATSGSDYTPLTGTATIAAGQSFVDVTLAPVNDTSVEGVETVILTLASGDYAITSTNTATVDISDATIVTVSVPDASASESTPNSGSFRLTRTGDTSQALTVNYTIAGTATNGSDYTALSGIATIAAGQSFVDVLVDPINDTIAEGDETIQLSLATGDYNLGSTTSGNVTILANDPTIRITPVTLSQVEGDSSSSNSTFTVELSNPSDEVVTVNYATADGTATTADNDYIANAGTLIFNPGVTSQTITIAVNGDTTFEADETFQVNLSAATNGTLSTLTQMATGLIGNDDAIPVYTFSTANYRTLEGDGPNVILLAMTRSGNLSQAASVQVQLSNGSAIAGRDFVGGVITVSFAAGQSVAYLPVQILGNRQPESDKTLNLSLVGLSEPGNYGEQTQASLTIINDDPLSHTIFRKGKGRSGIKVKKPKHRKLKRRK